jgi:aminodeoxychorismate synthase component I
VRHRCRPVWAFGYVAYEAAAGLDPQLAVHPSPPMGMPLAWFGICDEPIPVPPLEAAEVRTPAEVRPNCTARWQPTWTAAGHADDVALIRDRIAAGDTFQCNLTVRMAGRVAGDPFTLYRDLALGQRGAHNAYLDLGRFVVASASPELFFERRGEEVLLRPMKGTAPRGRHRDEDRRLAARLRSSAKERAENIMIVDLVRNYVGRVAETGSVDVPALFTVERYETVLHLTSDVTARLRPGTGLVELFRALFPCGSVTGAPKGSSMEIIRSVEPGARGVYCGAVGLVGPPDAPVRARFSVAIRTAVVDRATGEAVYGTGGGITWGSEAVDGHAEVLTKAAVLHARPREFELLETMRHEPRRGLRNRDRHLQRLAGSAEHLGFRFDLPAARELLSARLDGVQAARGPAPAGADRRAGRGRRTAAAVPARPGPARRRRRTGRPAGSPAVPPDDAPGTVRPAPRAAPRRRRRDHREHARGADRGHPSHPRAEARRAVVDTAGGVRVPPRRRAGPLAGSGAARREGAPAPGSAPRLGDRGHQLPARMAGGRARFHGCCCGPQHGVAPMRLGLASAVAAPPLDAARIGGPLTLRATWCELFHITQSGASFATEDRDLRLRP